jgi:hypothetical protein
MTPSSQKTIKTIDAMFDNVKFHTFVVNLANRWSDEKEYEDIQKYEDAIYDILPNGIKIIKMTKRPFGFHFSVEGVDSANIYAISCTEKSYSWNRVK